ncbi:MAG: hypothetical protein ACLQVL_12110 [Terriglobia bacterium]
MITNEAEIRIALQAVLISVLALYGCWGCAMVVFVILLPWKPIFAVGAYLAQPVVDWRVQKVRDRHDKNLSQIEKELDALLRAPRGTSGGSQQVPASKMAAPPRLSQSLPPRPQETFKPNLPTKPVLRDLAGTAQDLSATLAIPPAIKDHVRNLPQGVFSNMDLEVEEVKFHGERAEAYVRFRSPNVTELVIRQRYVLRKSGSQWQVESRQPANGGGKPPICPLPAGQPPIRIA